jgi:ribonuclease HII
LSRTKSEKDAPKKTGRVRKPKPPTCNDCFEQEAASLRQVPVAGADEVGRGALVGPVVAGAVILGAGFDWSGLDDSKKLTAEVRKELAERIRAHAAAWAIGLASVEEIDRYNIRQATFMAIRRAVAGLRVVPQLVLVDGIDEPLVGIPQRAIVKGDALSVSIAAASILAKVHRDSMIEALDVSCPGFGLKENKGYGSAAHLDALRIHGPSPFHRKSFVERTGWLF